MQLRGRLLALATLLVAAAPLLAAQGKADKPKEKAPPTALRGEYAMMASECKLSDEQKTRLEAAVKAKSDATAAWDKANATKLEDLRKQQADAREKKDADALKRIAGEMKPLTDARAKIESDQQAAILGVLTSDQRTAWEGFKLYRQAMARFKRVEPTDEQTAKIRSLCDQGGKDQAAVQGDAAAVRKGQAEIQKKLAAAIEADVLTAGQREKLKAPPPPKPEKPKTPPAEAKAPAQP
jgi:Spy/CpxP family protein refolding chaperone